MILFIITEKYGNFNVNFLLKNSTLFEVLEIDSLLFVRLYLAVFQFVKRCFQKNLHWTRSPTWKPHSLALGKRVAKFHSTSQNEFSICTMDIKNSCLLISISFPYNWAINSINLQYVLFLSHCHRICILAAHTNRKNLKFHFVWQLFMCLSFFRCSLKNLFFIISIFICDI